jgi:hypothetical protein
LRFPVIADDRVLDRYRQHPESMTARFAAVRARQARWNHLAWLEREVERAGVRGEAIRRSLARERWKLRLWIGVEVFRSCRRLVSRLKRASTSQGSQGGPPQAAETSTPTAS